MSETQGRRAKGIKNWSIFCGTSPATTYKPFYPDLTCKIISSQAQAYVMRGHKYLRDNWLYSETDEILRSYRSNASACATFRHLHYLDLFLM